MQPQKPLKTKYNSVTSACVHTELAGGGAKRRKISALRQTSHDCMTDERSEHIFSATQDCQLPGRVWICPRMITGPQTTALISHAGNSSFRRQTVWTFHSLSAPIPPQTPLSSGTGHKSPGNSQHRLSRSINSGCFHDHTKV